MKIMAIVVEKRKPDPMYIDVLNHMIVIPINDIYPIPWHKVRALTKRLRRFSSSLKYCSCKKVYNRKYKPWKGIVAATIVKPISLEISGFVSC